MRVDAAIFSTGRLMRIARYDSLIRKGAEHMENGEGWPGVGYIEATWHADDPAASRRQRALNRGTFRFAVPAVIEYSRASGPPDIALGGR